MVSDRKNLEISKEIWLRPSKANEHKIHSNCELTAFHDMLISKCWPDQQSSLMYMGVDLGVISDDDVKLNLYPIIRILENQRVRYQNDENLIEYEKQEVIKN